MFVFEWGTQTFMNIRFRMEILTFAIPADKPPVIDRILRKAAGCDVITVVQAVFACRKCAVEAPFSAVSFPFAPCVCVCRRVPIWPLCASAHGLSSLWVSLNCCVSEGSAESPWIAPSFPTVIGAICLGYVDTVGGMLPSIIHNFSLYCGRSSQLHPVWSWNGGIPGR